MQVAVEAFGRIDCLVSNAGICPFFSFLDIPHDVWALTRGVNLDGAFYVVQGEFERLGAEGRRADPLCPPLCTAVAKQMKVQEPQGGSIVAVSSISALVGGGEQA